MKTYPNFRLMATLLTFILSLLFMGSKEIKNRIMTDKANNKPNGEIIDFKISNSDYIFFESLSKYFFTSLP